MYKVSLVYNKRDDNHEVIEVEEELGKFETIDEAKDFSRTKHYKETEYRNWVIKIALDKKEESE